MARMPKEPNPAERGTAKYQRERSLWAKAVAEAAVAAARTEKPKADPVKEHKAAKAAPKPGPTKGDEGEAA